MKKIIALTLILVLALAGCSSAGGAAKLGLGQITSIGSSNDLAENDEGVMVGTAQVDTVMAAVMVDDKGKVVDIKIDTAQTRVNFDENGVITSDKEAEIKTKRELGNDYGMIKASGIGREWFEQIDAVEEWMTGKTASEIANMKLNQNDSGANIPGEADLTSKATLKIDDYLKVTAEAIANAG
ncbi:MAG: hypothetical protein PHE63_10630 [Eubacteriales bacterium]|nr:hypothetical protein [Eubacteriales bacterium]MDD3198493.1 hypothetical protein [Eubacteriales bacterium]MDD3504521.1 hypothetical protein [Eubacteriales bacterium]